jgi:hypothetical protein
MNVWRIGLMACLVLLHAVSAQARTIDAFAGGGGGSATHPGAGASQFDVTAANSFPPGNDPTGRIGSVSGAMAELVVRLESLAGPAGAMVTMAINTSTADSLGKFRILADAGMETRTILTWDGFETPGLGLGGQESALSERVHAPRPGGQLHGVAARARPQLHQRQDEGAAESGHPQRGSAPGDPELFLIREAAGFWTGETRPVGSPRGGVL